MEKIIKEQIQKLKKVKSLNMFDLLAVQRAAFEMSFYELESWLRNHEKEYCKYILTGEE